MLGQIEIKTTVVLEKWNWDNCHIGTNGIVTTVILGQMELGQLPYWDNCPIGTNGIGTTVIVLTV